MKSKQYFQFDPGRLDGSYWKWKKLPISIQGLWS